MRIAIVNDTLMCVFALKKIIESTEEHSIAWIANDGAEAVKACVNDVPDLILMDIIMPVMDGVEATKEIMEKSPCAILLVTSSIENNAPKVFEAMGAGALDAINTPILESSDGEALDTDLLNKISMIGKLISHSNNKQSPSSQTSYNKTQITKTPLIAIGSSTGGPSALVTTLSNIPKDFPASFVIVQHVDEQFVDSFVRWLNDQVAMPVRLAKSGDIINVGTILVADSKKHLSLSQNQTLSYTKHPEDYPYIPSVNIFFESIAHNWEGDALGILLTGMGRDGANGLLEMKNRGYPTIAQEESSCAVYGMPKAAVEINAANLVLSPVEINKKIVQSFVYKDNTPTMKMEN